MRRSLALLVPLVVLVACGDDDDAADRATTTVVDGASTTDTTAPAEAEDDEPTEGAASETVPDTTVPVDAPAGDAPDGADGGDGLGDAVLAGDLDGRGPVPGAGDTAATGRVEAELVDGTLCVDLVASGLDAAVTEAHLHGGPEGEEGPVLVDLGPPSTSDGGDTTWTDVCTGVDDDVIDDLAAAPELAYVDVHTASFPDGAIRGQLGVISIFDRTLD